MSGISLPVFDAPVPEHPLLRPGLRIVPDGRRLLLEHGQHLVVLEGKAVGALLPVLLPLLDGRRTSAEIAARLELPTPAPVEHAIRLLARHGAVCEGPPLDDISRPLRELSEMLASEGALAPVTVSERLAGPVAVVGRSRAAEAIRALLAAAGVPTVAPLRWRSARGELVVAAPGRGEAGALRRWNRRALRLGIPWLCVLPFDGRAAVVGPLVLPGETACYECYLLRRAAAVGFGADADALDLVQPRARSTSAFDGLVACLAALHALRWLGIRDPRLPGLLQTVEPAEGVELTRHLLLRVPRCPACSVTGAFARPLPWHGLPLEDEAAA